MTTPDRSPCGTMRRMRLDPVEQTQLLHHRDDALARGEPVEAVAAPARRPGRRRRQSPRAKAALSPQRERASASRMLIIGRLCRRPTWKSLKSCAGVILTAPEPFSGSRIVVGDDRDAAADERQHGEAAHESRVALVGRMHRDGGVAQHGLRPRGRDDDERGPGSLPRSDRRSARGCRVHLDRLRPRGRRWRSGTCGSQLTSRLSR